jgi:speckle-type POZ protein
VCFLSSDMASCSSSSSVQNQVALPETTSTCLTQSITGAHNFVVTNFSQLEGMGIGNCVSSGTFTVGGCRWKINLYPDGAREAADGACASVYLYFLEGPVGTRIKFDVSLFGNDDDLQVSSSSNNKKKRSRNKTGKGNRAASGHGTRTCGWPDSDIGFGWPKFIEKCRLRESSDDCFTIRIVLTVFKTRTDDAAAGAIQVPPSSLRQDLARMLEDAEGADITIEVGDRVFLAHKHVLAARSRVFKAQLFGVMRESSAGCIRIDDMEPCVFERLLRYIYTDALSSEDRNVVAMMQHLLVAADRYGVDRLRLMCEERLCGWIDVQSVATTLVLAEQHQCAQLKDACLGFVAWRGVLPAVMETEGFKHLKASCPAILEEILEKIASVRIQ